MRSFQDRSHQCSSADHEDPYRYPCGTYLIKASNHYFTIRPGLFEARVFVSSDIKDCRTNHLVRQPLFYSNVYERIRTSDPSLRSSPEFCLARYHRLSNIACFQAFWMVRIAYSYHCYHLIPTSLMPSLLQPCCKARKFSRTSSVSISTI